VTSNGIMPGLIYTPLVDPWFESLAKQLGSDDPRVAKRQDFFNPLQRVIACGCNMNRPIGQLIKSAGLEIIKLDRYTMPDTPRVLGEMYRGVARTV